MNNNTRVRVYRTTRVMVGLGMTSLLAGCGTELCNGFNVDADNNGSISTGTIRVSIDGSGSMLGYTRPQGSEFNAVVEELDSMLGVKNALSIQNSETKFFRIGRDANGKVRTDRVTSLLTARSPAFYDGTSRDWPAVSSSIDRFATPDLNSIDILVSDLEPDQSAIQQLISSIKPKLFHAIRKKSWFGKQDSATGNVELALVGIQSQFNGGVFPSVAGQFPSFQYNGIRPFYLLILGDTATVEQVIAQLTKVPEISGKIQISRFAADPNSGYTVFAKKNGTSIAPPCVIPTFAINKGLGGRMRFDQPDNWILAKATNQCPPSLQLSINFKGADSVGFRLADTAVVKPFGNSEMIKSFSISSSGFNIVAQPQVSANSLTTIELPLDNASVDQVIWRDWSTTSINPIGSRTQRLLQLIRRIRSETDEYSQQNYGAKYSTLRMCSVIKT